MKLLRSGCIDKAWRIWCALAAKLCEVQICSGPVAGVHALAELVLRPESVEDNAVDGHNDQLDNDLDNTADQTPILQPTNKRIVDILLE